MPKQHEPYFQLYNDLADAQLRMEAAGIDPNNVYVSDESPEAKIYLHVLNLQLHLKRMFGQWEFKQPELKEEIRKQTVEQTPRELARDLLDKHRKKNGESDGAVAGS